MLQYSGAENESLVWNAFAISKKKGNVISGRVVRASPNGYWVDVEGVIAYLPAVRARSPEDSKDAVLLGLQISALIVRIDYEGRRVLLDRKKFIQKSINRERADIRKEMVIV